MTSKQFISILFIFHIVFTSSCNITDKRPAIAEEYLRNKIEQESKGYIRLTDFKKQDGKEFEINGVRGYEMDFSGFFQYQNDCYKVARAYSSWLYNNFSVRLTKPKGWDAYNSGLVKECKKGLKVGYIGKATFEKKESGWNIISLKITETKDHGIEPIIESDTNISTAKYSFDQHQDFKIFFEDFKKALTDNDKEAIAQMTHFPFEDNHTAAYQHIDPTLVLLSAKNEKQLHDKFELIFIKETIEAAKANQYRGYEYEELLGGDVIGPGEYLLQVSSAPNAEQVYDLAFAKHDGVYKLSYIPYMP